MRDVRVVGTAPVAATAAPTAAAGAAPVLSATVQVAALDPGLYAFGRGPEGAPAAAVEGVPVPAVHLTHAPGSERTVQVVDVPGAGRGWLVLPGETVIVSVAPGGGRILITTYRASDQPAGTVGMRMTRLDPVLSPGPVPSAMAPVAAPPAWPARSPEPEPPPKRKKKKGKHG